MRNQLWSGCGRVVAGLRIAPGQTAIDSTSTGEIHNAVGKLAGFSEVCGQFFGSFSPRVLAFFDLLIGDLCALSTAPMKTTTKFYTFISLPLLGACS